MESASDNNNTMYATTILAVRYNGQVAIAGDGQVSFGNTVMKSTAKKIRRLYKDKILAGFAGATADAFTLAERLEKRLDKYAGHLLPACIDLAKDWRLDRYLRKLEAMIIVADQDTTLVLTGNGDVLEPEGGVAAIGSGGNYALAAARALIGAEVTGLTAQQIALQSLNVAADICIYTNHNIISEVL